MDDLLNDKHFKELTKNNRKAGAETTKEDIALRLITDCAILQETESFVTFLNVNYSERLSRVAKMLNDTVSDEYVRDIRKRIKKALKDIYEILGKDITQRIGDVFSLALFEILYLAFLFEVKPTRKEVLRDVVYKYIDDNAYKISRSGNNSVVKYRERLMLAHELNKVMNI